MAHRVTNTPAAVHSWKRRWAEELEQRPVAFRAFHWQPVRRTKKMASIARRSSTLGLWPPNRCAGRGGRSDSIRSQRTSGIRHRSSWTDSDSEGDFEASRALATGGSPGAVASSRRSYEQSYWDRLLAQAPGLSGDGV